MIRGIFSEQAGALDSSLRVRVAFAGCSWRLSLRNCWMTPCRRFLTRLGCLFGWCTIRCTSGSKARFSALSNGLMLRACSRASCGGIPLGRRAGKAAPDRCVMAAVDASTAARCRFLGGSNPDRSWVSQSDRKCSEAFVFSIGFAGQLRGCCPRRLHSSELADAVKGSNTALTATAVVGVSLGRLNRGLKVCALIPHLVSKDSRRLHRGVKVSALVPPTL